MKRRLTPCRAIVEMGGRPGLLRVCKYPTWDSPVCLTWRKRPAARAIAMKSQAVCASHGVTITELSVHLQGQLVAVHPAYDTAFDAFAPLNMCMANLHERQAWAVDQVSQSCQVHHRNFGLDVACAAFTGSLAFPYVYPLAAAACWIGGRSVQRTGASVEAHFGCLRCGRCRFSFRNPPW